MDRVTTAIALFRNSRANAADEEPDKLRAVEELSDVLDNVRSIKFLLQIVASPDQYDLARVEILKVLAVETPPAAINRRRCAAAIATVLRRSSDDELVRQYA